MGKTTDRMCTNKIKKIICASLFFGGMLVILALGICLYSADYSVMYIVKFIHWEDEVEIQKYHKGEKISLPSPPAVLGYNFKGWALDDDDNKILTDEIRIESELTLYARWEEKVYTLIYNNEEISITYNHQILINGNKVTIVNGDKEFNLLAPETSDKAFVKWSIFDGQNYYDLDTFKNNVINVDKLFLIPIYDDITFNFDIKENTEFYEIKDVSHIDSIPFGESLTFRVSLKDKVSNSDISIISTSGSVSFTKVSENEFDVLVNDPSKDFNVEINNIQINLYPVTIINNEEVIDNYVYHGENLSFPVLDNPGYKLKGFKDVDGRYYTEEYVVSSGLILYVVWEKEGYSISFPKTNGDYVISINNEIVNTNKNIVKFYGESLTFKINLSAAYNTSDYIVYGISKNGKEFPVQLHSDEHMYSFVNISSDLEIFIEGITLNSYNVNVDGVDYGAFNYGAWIVVANDAIVIKDMYNNVLVQVNSIIEDEHFGGWLINNEILTNSMVQDIANASSGITIYGNYSKKVARIQLNANGGMLDVTEIVVVEGEEFKLPQPIKFGYTFAGWFVKLVEVNTVVDENASVKFEEIDSFNITLYAGWVK